MDKLPYIAAFEKLGLGLFVHFGLYSCLGQGEWYLHLNPEADPAQYQALTVRFQVDENWARELVALAKTAGCRYITLTARHHDGFSLYHTCGLSLYDAPHSACGRDLIAEFVDECHKGGILPFFYHTLLDWQDSRYREDFPAYLDYLVSSIELLCRNYGPIGGFWFDGMWDKPGEDWQEDRLYGTIRKFQPNAMIINNTGLSEQGKVGHREIDSVTFERGRPQKLDTSDKYRAGEMCQVLNDHWGYAQFDLNYKSPAQLIGDLLDCRLAGCNLLLNTGLLGNGSIRSMDRCLLELVGDWINKNRGFLYHAFPSAATAQGADILEDEDGTLYAVVRNVGMSADPHVGMDAPGLRVTVHRTLKRAIWLDSGQEISLENNSFLASAFPYGQSLCHRIARLEPLSSLPRDIFL